MNRILEATLPTALLVIVFGTPAQAQEGRFLPSPISGLIESADANNDGVVTRAELAAIDVFAKLDTNQDGKLSFADGDHVLFHGARRGSFLLRAADEDQDGKLTKADLQGWFNKIDDDADGVLQPEELRAVMPPPPDVPDAPEAPAPPEPPSKTTATRRPLPNPVMVPRPPMPPPPVAPPELTANELKEMFDAADTNGDGLLDSDELPPGLHIWQQRIQVAPAPKAGKSGG